MTQSYMCMHMHMHTSSVCNAYAMHVQHMPCTCQVMAQYGVTDEAALLSGQVTHFAAAQHAGSKAHDVAEWCEHAVGAVAHALRTRYERALAAAAERGCGPESVNPAAHRDDQLRLAAAWYLAAYSDPPAGGQPYLAAHGDLTTPPGAPPRQLLSFAWVAHVELTEIRRHNQGQPSLRGERVAAEVRLAELMDEVGSGGGDDFMTSTGA